MRWPILPDGGETAAGFYHTEKKMPHGMAVFAILGWPGTEKWHGLAFVVGDSANFPFIFNEIAKES